MIVRIDNVLDWLICYFPDVGDKFLRLFCWYARIDNKHSIITDDNAGIHAEAVARRRRILKIRRRVNMLRQFRQPRRFLRHHKTGHW